MSEQKEVDITSLWGDSDRAFLVFARSMGCNFCQQLGALQALWCCSSSVCHRLPES